VYRRHLETIRAFVDAIPNLQTIGRNGMHKYNNQDHSMYTAMLAVANLEGATHDLWAVNSDLEYHEEQRLTSEVPIVTLPDLKTVRVGANGRRGRRPAAV
jgi:hypothetical protein